MFSTIIAGGGHGFYQPIFALFPFATFSCIWKADMSFINLVIAIVQFPLYGLWIDKTSNEKRTWIVILTFHVVLATLIILFANPNWNN